MGSCTLSDRILEVLDLFVRWSDAVRAVQLFEVEWLEDKAAVEVLSLVLNSNLLQEIVTIGVRRSHLVRWHKVDTLRNSLETRLALGCRVYSCAGQIDPRDQANPDLVFICLLDERDVFFVRPTVLDAHPLVLADLVALGLVDLVDDWHLFCRHHLVRVEHEVKTFARLPNVSLFECFNENVAFGGIRARDRQNHERIASLCEIDGLAQECVARSSLELLLYLDLPQLWVIDRRQVGLRSKLGDCLGTLREDFRVVFLRHDVFAFASFLGFASQFFPRLVDGTIPFLHVCHVQCLCLLRQLSWLVVLIILFAPELFFLFIGGLLGLEVDELASFIMSSLFANFYAISFFC